ncbi:MAG: GntR family transcriptional regulator [Acidobacteria bacterium]|nr:MAG: GntR family transcriptional regulator [Acidobacteriota bacterium]REK09765.1 MAG: GntR family transcriptional regulator [Acidobacteriota bacterium]
MSPTAPYPAPPAASEQPTAEDRPEMVYRELRELIVSGRMAPGSRLVETTAAERLGVSRTPVRSAFHRLLREGYVVAANKDGERQRLVVAPVTADDASDLFHIVGEIEGLAAFYAASLELGRREQLIDRLEVLNATLLKEARATTPDAHRAFELDIEFHQEVVLAAAPPRLHALHRAIKPQADRYARLYVSALTNRLDLSAAEHEDIVTAIDQGDPDRAQSATQTNWRNAAHRVADLIRAWGESGRW